MQLLILGGTKFLGRALTEAALARGHAVTLFHRGRTNPGLFPLAECVHGDRDGGLDALGDRSWDAVADLCGYLPRVVRQSARALTGRARHYVFVSSISAHAEPMAAGADESAPLATLADPSVEELRGDTYGGLKALCEAEVSAAFPGRAAIVRPGLIVGPHDPSDRFPYWPRRLALGGEVLAPGRPEAPVQIVDARDLAAWMLALAERARAGTFNAVGPERALTLGETLEACRAASGGSVRLTWVDEAFLLEHGVTPWTELPLWTPAADESFARVSVARAIAAGLTFRPLVDTARDTLAWDRETPPARAPILGAGPLTAEREAELLAAWHARRGAPASLPAE